MARGYRTHSVNSRTIVIVLGYCDEKEITDDERVYCKETKHNAGRV